MFFELLTAILTKIISYICIFFVLKFLKKEKTYYKSFEKDEKFLKNFYLSAESVVKINRL